MMPVLLNTRPEDRRRRPIPSFFGNPAT